MKKILLSAVLLCGTLAAVNAQIYKAQSTKIDFYSYTPMENISATDTIAVMLLNGATNDVVAKMNIKDFHFPNSLMEDHFNENYMETDKEGPKDANGKPTYPNRTASLTGKINEKVDYTKDGTYNVTITGNLTIHGVTQPRTIPATLTIKDGTITIDSKFDVKLVDHKINVPEAVGQKIAETIQVTVHTVMVNASKKK